MRIFKNCSALVAAGLWILTAFSAAAQNSNAIQVGDETYWALSQDSLRRKGEQRILEDYKFKNNLWFQFLVGTYNNWGSHQRNYFGPKHFRPSAGIAMGKWFHPTVGARLVLDYGNNRGISYDKDGLRKPHYWNTAEAAVDVLLNMSNLFCRYNENRIFNFVLFFGVGANQTFGFSDRDRAYVLDGAYDSDTKKLFPGFQKAKCTLLTFRAGAMGIWRISKKWDLSFEVSNNWVDDSYDGVITNNRTDGHVNAYIGFIRRLRYGNDQYNFRFRRYEASHIAKMNDEINKVRRQTQEQLRNVPTDYVSSHQVNTLVSFKRNSWNLDELQQVNIFTVVEKMKELNLTMPAYIVPLAGGGAVDKSLFQKRAETIRQTLKQEYGISENLIKMDSEAERIEAFSKGVDCIIIYVNENKD